MDFLQPDMRLARNQSSAQRKHNADARLQAMMAAREHEKTPWPKPDTDMATALKGRLFGPVRRKELPDLNLGR